MSVPMGITSRYGLDASIDDLASADEDTGFDWGSVWNDLSTNASSIWDSSLKTGGEVADFFIKDFGTQLTEKDSGVNQTDNSGSTLDSNANTSQGNLNQNGGFKIDQKTMLIGGGVLAGIVVLVAVLK